MGGQELPRMGVAACECSQVKTVPERVLGHDWHLAMIGRAAAANSWRASLMPYSIFLSPLLFLSPVPKVALCWLSSSPAP